MSTSARLLGRVLTGFGALALLGVLLVGAPVALLAFAGNPLPSQVPTLGEIGTVLTSRDDGQLFIRVLAVAGWVGWATFALSVLVELGALAVRRPAPRLPGMGRQQRAAAALVGSVALILAASPVAASAAAVAAGPPASTAAVAGPPLFTASTVAPTAASTASTTAPADVPERAPVYRVARGDHLGSIAARYLDGFEDYRSLATLNRLADPDRIHPGQLLRLPAEAHDRGPGPHATGRLVARPTPPRSPAPAPASAEQSTPPSPAESAGADLAGADSAVSGMAVSDASSTDTAASDQVASDQVASDPAAEVPVVAVGAAGPGDPNRVNRPLAVSAVLAVSSIVGAQIGAALGLRRRPATARTGTDRRPLPGQRRWELPAGRHRRD
ncbi:LysM domain-containing protein [Salinispora sp. H7-4]|uniref:LysM peptidoglycan-binding domain-containing protein n=1 Tax=Salinispora sp. H7-4 TaxID=2748321 RepID=UPI0015D1C183|nr:LysM domain-containing protein [Salinispora sp. H7-4]NYT93526.1 LysM peptidoglycan-binding domain-containing protein [Salinispora sp. H7-4]